MGFYEIRRSETNPRLRGMVGGVAREKITGETKKKRKEKKKKKRRKIKEKKKKIKKIKGKTCPKLVHPPLAHNGRKTTA
eukprot:jgi/Bigna1/140750/aug1.58_g15458